MIKVMNCKKISDAACAVYFFMMRLPKPSQDASVIFLQFLSIYFQ